MYRSYLRVFEFDAEAWKLREPNDWNLVRRMLRAGVRMGFVDAVVSRHYMEQTQAGG